MATIRDCYLVDMSFYGGLEIVYCDYLKNVQNQLKRYTKCYTVENIPDMADKVVYTSNVIMSLKKALKKIRKMYIQDIPKLRVDS